MSSGESTTGVPGQTVINGFRIYTGQSRKIVRLLRTEAMPAPNMVEAVI